MVTQGDKSLVTLGDNLTVTTSPDCHHSRANMCVRVVILRQHDFYFSNVTICHHNCHHHIQGISSLSTLRTHTPLVTVVTLRKSPHPGISRNRFRINGLIVANDALHRLKCRIVNVLQRFCNSVLPTSYDDVSAGYV